MGGAQSQFHDTDWEKGDGGVKDASLTFDGSNPTSNHIILTCKKHNPVNQREYNFINEDGVILYTTKAVEGTTKDFDLLNETGTKLFHIQTNSSHTRWDIYSYRANFDKQNEVDIGLNIKVNEPLYYKALVKIAWDKYHGEVHLYEPSNEDPKGIVGKEAILKVEEIKSTMAAFQSFVPNLHLSLTHAPLCGYWLREYTNKTDIIKMHLSSHTDIALHCILAVVTNLVNVERQAEKCA